MITLADVPAIGTSAVEEVGYAAIGHFPEHGSVKPGSEGFAIGPETSEVKLSAIWRGPKDSFVMCGAKKFSGPLGFAVFIVDTVIVFVVKSKAFQLPLKF